MTSPSPDEIVMGTRGSLLAVTQTQWVVSQIQRYHPDLQVRVERITTTGDRDQKAPLPEVGQKGIFTKELEDALLDGRIDLAVHSAKDLPEQMPEGLDLLCIPAREDPRDALISRDGVALQDLPRGAVLGTSSLRRQAQLRLLRPDFEFTVLRGNVDTRIRKVRRGDCDATLLAAAGLNRVNLAEEATAVLDVDTIVPAPHQGILAVQGRSDDDRLRSLLEPVGDATARVAFRCERMLVERLEGGCTTPIGFLVEVEGDVLTATGVIASPDGRRSARVKLAMDFGEREALVERVIDELSGQGARDIIAACRA